MDVMSYLMGRNSGGSKGLKVEVVTELPDTGEEGILYLVPKDDTGESDIFDEWIWVEDDWEHIGSTDIDLSNYLAKNNTTAFTPTGDYNPATKKYVDDKIWVGTQTEYDNLQTHSNDIIYFIKDDEDVSA